jgi:hypothetical protein
MENPNNFIGPRPRGYFSFPTLISQIVTSGSTPHLYLIKRYAWWLIALVVVPPLIHDLVDYLTPRTAAEQLDLDREQRRLLFKLRHAIGGWQIRGVAESDASAAASTIRKFCDAFRTDFAANWHGPGRGRRAKTGLKEQRVKSKHIEECLRDVLAFDKKSDDAVAGALMLADALHVRMHASPRARPFLPMNRCPYALSRANLVPGALLRACSHLLCLSVCRDDEYYAGRGWSRLEGHGRAGRPKVCRRW